MTSLITEETMALAREMTYAAGQKLRDYRGHVVGKSKGFRDYVSEADLASESVLLDAITSNFPDHGILSEESRQNSNEDSDYLWIIDPLDGTSNYLWDIPVSVVSVALAHRGQLQLGIVYDPWRDEMIWGWQGHGVHLNEHPVNVSSHTKLGECIVGTDFGYSGVRAEVTAALAKSLLGKVTGLRAFSAGALTLAYVACGRLDAYFNFGFNAWDMAAGAFLVIEAGGKSTNLRGGDVFLTTNSCLASNGHVHEEILGIWQRDDVYERASAFAAMPV